MGKSLINTQKWGTDDFRLLVVMLLTIVYPLFISAFFALYVFVLMPLMVEGHYSIYPGVQKVYQDGWYHYYWLFVALLWLLLCAIILPCFQDGGKSMPPVVGMEVRGNPQYPTKPHAVQPPFVKVEEFNEKERPDSILTEKSKRSNDSFEKGGTEEKADNESLEKSTDNLAGSISSLQERSKLVESGEFLNECMDPLTTEDLKQKEAECEVHAEEDTGNTQEDSDKENVREDSEKEESIKTDDLDATEQSNDFVMLEVEDCKSLESTEDLLDPPNEDKDDFMANEEAACTKEDIKPQKTETEPLVEQADMVYEKTRENDDELDLQELNMESPKLRGKANMTINTSEANENYECSMPTPKSASAKRESNMVFLYVNPDVCDKEENIKVVHPEGAEVLK